MLYVKETETHYRAATSDELASALKKSLEQHFDRLTLTSPTLIGDYLSAQYALRSHEVFGLLALDAHLQLIALEELAHGTPTSVSVSTRTIVELLLVKHPSCTNVAVFHNHPSGNAEPSMADLDFTKKLKAALATVEVKLIDHFIVAGTKVVSLRTGNESCFI